MHMPKKNWVWLGSGKLRTHIYVQFAFIVTVYLESCIIQIRATTQAYSTIVSAKYLRISFAPQSAHWSLASNIKAVESKINFTEKYSLGGGDQEMCIIW